MGSQPESSNASRRTGGTAYPFGMSPRVLIVDDEPVLVRLLEVNFRSAGFEVRTALRGEEAVAEAAAEAPDVVLLDLGLPDMDGEEVLRKLRQLPGMREVPIVVVSGTDRDATPGRGYASGVFAHLTKPADPAALVETARRAIAARD